MPKKCSTELDRESSRAWVSYWTTPRLYVHLSEQLFVKDTGVLQFSNCTVAAPGLWDNPGTLPGSGWLGRVKTSQHLQFETISFAPAPTPAHRYASNIPFPILGSRCDTLCQANLVGVTVV